MFSISSSIQKFSTQPLLFFGHNKTQEERESKYPNLGFLPNQAKQMFAEQK